jgi:subtilisin family serine protease
MEKEMKRSSVISILLIALLTSFGQIANAGEMEQHFEAYLGTLSDQDFASAIVYLKDRPDIRAMDQTLHESRAPLAVRHKTVIRALKEAAGRSQPSLLSYLDRRIQAGTVEGYTPYWIMNVVVVYATKGELYEIAQRPEVEAIEGNFKASLIKPTEGPTTLIPPIGIGVTNSLRAINADSVWYKLGITGLGRLIGSMDTGVDGAHLALADRWRGNWHPWQECWRDALGFGTTYPVDNMGHGTHTMGTMCGLGYTTGDTIGVAWEAQWIADNSIGQLVNYEFENDVLGAFEWFADPDGDDNTIDDVPDVVNCSWGVTSVHGYDYQDCDYRWQGVIMNCEAIGVVCTFAAGNYGPNTMTIQSPANICSTTTMNFSIGAVDAEHHSEWPYPIWLYSSRGPSDCNNTIIKPEVCAPGYDVYSSINTGGYYYLNGTSMATAHVSGVVALTRQANPDIDVQTIKEVLMSTSRDLGEEGPDNTYGEGFIDAYAAVKEVLTTYPPLPDYRIEEPTHWYHPPIKVQPGQDRTLKLWIFNRGEEEILWTCVCEHQCIDNATFSGYLSPGCSLSLSPKLIGTGVCNSTLIDGNIVLNIDQEEYNLPVLAIVADDYYECPIDPQTVTTLDNGVLRLNITTCGDHRISDVSPGSGGYYEVFPKGGTIVATIQQGDTLVGRFMPEDWHAGARDILYTDECNQDSEPDFWIVYTKNVFIHDLEPPVDTKWWWFEISEQTIFFKETAPEVYKHLVISYIRDKVHSPPNWWQWDCPLGWDDTYIGVAEDINCPWSSGIYGANLGGYDSDRHIAWQHGCDMSGLYPQFNNYYCGIALAEGGMLGDSIEPYGSHCVRSDEYLYPQNGWGWRDDELYQLASTPDNSIQDPTDSVDRAYVLTAREIPASPDPFSPSYVPGSFTVVRVVAPGGLGQLQEYVDSARAIVERTGYDYGDQGGLPAICGDVNGNGVVNLGDASYLLGYLYKGQAPPLCPMNRADVNSNGAVNQGDVVYLLNYLFNGGPAPVCPGIWFL